MLAEGLTWSEIRAKLDCSDSYIARWSKRFVADRLAGLFARYAGRERYKVTDRMEAQVLARTTKHQPADGSTHWSSRKLAAELGHISHMTVARIWAKHGIRQAGLWTTMIGESNHDLAYLLAWESLAERERKWTAFTTDPEWVAARKESEKDGPIVANIVSSILHPTSFSSVR